MAEDDEGGVQVAVRMRIFNQREKDNGCERIVRMSREDVGSKTWIKNPDTDEEKEFKFDFSFQSHSMTEPGIGQWCTQDDVFNDLGRPVLLSALTGCNVCLFAYGQTGAGKSFSMLGKSQPPEMQGIIPRTCREIFKILEEVKDNPLITASVSIQTVEVYCEQINDLLADRKVWPAGGHKPRLTKDGYTVDTVTKPCFNYDDIESAFSFADKNRSVGSHALNPESSRAHTIYQINYEKKTKTSPEAKQAETVFTRINLVDLAGSERMESAGTSGQMLKEGNAINLSLTALGNTIKALSEGKRASFRDSKLTLLLQASMTNGKVIMIAALSPASINYDETLSTLRFAERIKMVKIKAKKNVTVDPVAEIKKEMEEMRERMQKEIDELKIRAGDAPMPEGGLGGSGGGGADPEEVARLKALLEEQKNMQKALEEDMAKRMAEMNETDADKKARADAINTNWTSALGGAVLDPKKVSGPHLLNLNEDSRLAETLVYAMKEGDTVIGRSNKAAPPDLEFNGMGIIKGHCVVTWDKEGGKVVMKPAPKSRCVVNGKPQSAEIELKHNYRVWLGNNYAFRFAFPGKEEDGDKFTEEAPCDYLFAEDEIAKNSSSGLEGGGALSHQLSEALKKVEQANIIATDLTRDCVFSPKIIKNRISGEDVVVVSVALPQGTLNWPWDKFNVKLVEMVRVWQDWQFAQSNEKPFEMPKDEDNPFLDFDYQLIGEADVWLQSLGNMIEHDVKASILSPTSQNEGRISVEINPLDELGKEGPWDDGREDLDPFVEDVSELEGKEIGFIVKVPSLVFDVNVKDGGACKYHDVWVRYKIDAMDSEEVYTESEHVADLTLEPKFNHSKKFKRLVDSKFAKQIKDGRITLQVWGKLTTNIPAGAVKELPPGWKKIAAYEDPEGKLHKTLPKKDGE